MCFQGHGNLGKVSVAVEGYEKPYNLNFDSYTFFCIAFIRFCEVHVTLLIVFRNLNVRAMKNFS